MASDEPKLTRDTMAQHRGKGKETKSKKSSGKNTVAEPEEGSKDFGIEDTCVPSGTTSPNKDVASSDKKAETTEGTETGNPKNFMGAKLSIYLIVALFIAAIAVLGGDYIYNARQSPPTLSPQHKDFMKKMNHIFEQLKDTQSNLKFVNKTLNVYITKENHEAPAIVLFLGTNRSSCLLCHTVWDFVDALNKFHEELAPSLDSGYIPEEQVGREDDNNCKVYIENSINETVNQGKHTIMFEDIDKFPIASLSKVHSYLDDINSPQKDLVYILTATVTDWEKGHRVEKSKELRSIANKHFDRVWEAYDEDHRRPIMGRMTSVIGFIDESDQKTKGTPRSECTKKCDL